MSGFRVVSSMPFQDGAGNQLAVILETNHRSWKLFVRHTPAGLPSADSEWVNYPTSELGKAGFAETVERVRAEGWEEVS